MNEILICPVCQKPLAEDPDSNHRKFECENHHSFDRSKSGYLNLSHKQKVSGDNREMVRARTAFLEEGYYDFLRQYVASLIEKLNIKTLIDIGCGQGWYTGKFAEVCNNCYGVDLSKEAILHASKTDKKTQYIVASIYRLPFASNSADGILSIFTPIPEDEILRVLKPGGYFIRVSPGKMHHYELKEVLYENIRLNDDPKDLSQLNFVSRSEISEKIHVQDPMSLLEMTPYRYRCPKEGLEKLEQKKDGLDVTFDFLISLWQKPEQD